MRLLTDTLKGPNGKYSRKSVTMFASFLMSMLIGGYIVISDYFLDHEVNRYAIEVFNGFLIMAAALSGLTVFDKKSIFRSQTTTTETVEIPKEQTEEDA